MSKRKGMADIPHIPDRSLWSSQGWTYCSHSTLSWLHCWRKNYYIMCWNVTWPVKSRATLPQWILMMFVVSLGAVGNHPFLLAGHWAQCYHLGTGFRLVCSTGFTSHLPYMWTTVVRLFSHDMSVSNVPFIFVFFSPESNYDCNWISVQFLFLWSHFLYSFIQVTLRASPV